MAQKTDPPGTVSLLRLGPSSRIWLAILTFCLATGAKAQPGASAEASPPPPPGTVAIDFLHPEAFRAATWVNVSLPSNTVLVGNLRIITANRSWGLQICGSVSIPASCVNTLAAWDPRGVGWRGDFRSATWTQTYQDLDAGKQLHLKVTPQGGDWMIFRIKVEATPTP